MPNLLFTALAGQTADLLQTLRPSVALVRGADGHGAGVVWTADGLIVTNDHVVRGDHAAVELSDGRRLDAKVLARDRANDLALLRVPSRDLSAAPLGDSQSLRVGELIVAVGHPWGVRETATLGIVSATGVGAWTGRTRRGRPPGRRSPSPRQLRWSACQRPGRGRRHRQHGPQPRHRTGRARPRRPTLRRSGPGPHHLQAGDLGAYGRTEDRHRRRLRRRPRRA